MNKTKITNIDVWSYTFTALYDGRTNVPKVLNDITGTFLARGSEG